jgi:hypothetical protein
MGTLRVLTNGTWIEVPSVGPPGPPGPGVPTGGATGQVLAKKSNQDFDAQWVTLGGGGTAPPPPSIQEEFFDNFESGDALKWPTRTGAYEVIAGAAYAGGFGARFTPANTDESLGTATTKWSQTGRPWGSLVLRFRFNTLSAVGQTASVMTLQNLTQVANVDLFLSSTDRQLTWDLFEPAGEWYKPGFVPTVGTWYTFQCRYFVGSTTWTADFKLNGTQYPQLTSTGRASSSMRALRIGAPGNSTATYSLDIDDVRLIVADGDPGWINPV